MTEEEKLCYQQKLLKFIVALRDVGLETKFHIYDILLDPHNTRKRKSQFIVVAIVSKEEVIEENFSVLKEFTDYLHELQNPSSLVTKVVHYQRVAFAMNAGEKYFFEHGECRLFDPYKKFLFKIIDGETLSQCEGNEKNKGKRMHTLDKGGIGVLENMENAYMKMYHNFNDAVVLLFSFYIPCSIDFHDCARLLKEFVESSGHEMVIGYEHIHHFTDKLQSLKWLDLKNVTVLSNKDLKREILYQFRGFIRQNYDDVRWLEYDSEFDYQEDLLYSFFDDIHEFKARKHSRYFGKSLCKRVQKSCNGF